MDDEMDLYGDLEESGDVVQGNSKDEEKLKSSEKLDNDKHEVQNKPSDEEMYDYLYGGQNKVEDLYDDIINPEANEAMLVHIKELKEKVKKSDQHMALLKSQIAVLTNLNKDLREKNINCEKNLSSLKVTARTEINRKNEQITSLRRELDDVLFRRSARNLNKRELEDILSRHKSSGCAGCTAKILLPVNKKEKSQIGLDEKARAVTTSGSSRPVTTSGSPNDVCVGNRQVNTKKKRRICVDNLPRPQQNVPEKKVKLGDEEEKNVTEAKVDVVGKVPNGGIKKSNEAVKQANSRQSGQSKLDRVKGEVKVDLIKKYLVQKPANRKSSKLFQNSPDSSIVSSDRKLPCSKTNMQKPFPDSDLTTNISKLKSDSESSQGRKLSNVSDEQKVASLKTSEHLEKNTNEGSPVEAGKITVPKADEQIVDSVPKSPEDVGGESSPAKSTAWEGSSEYLEITPDLPIKSKPELVKSTFGEFVKGRSTPLIVKASKDSSAKPVYENLTNDHPKTTEKASDLGRKSRSPERRQRPNILKKSTDKPSSSTGRKSPQRQLLNETKTSSKVQSRIDKSGATVNDLYYDKEKPVPINNSHHKIEKSAPINGSRCENEKLLNEKPTSGDTPSLPENSRLTFRKEKIDKQKLPNLQYNNEKKKEVQELNNEKQCSFEKEKSKSPTRSSESKKPVSPVRKQNKEMPECNDKSKSLGRQTSKGKPTSMDVPAHEENVKSPIRQPSKEEPMPMEKEKVRSPVRQPSKEKAAERAAFDEKDALTVKKSHTEDGVSVRQLSKENPQTSERPLKEIHKSPGIITGTVRITSPRRKPDKNNSPLRQSSIEKQSLTENITHIERPKSPVGHNKMDRQKSPMRQFINDTTHEKNPMRQSNQVMPRPSEKKSHNESSNIQMRPVLPKNERQKSPMRQSHNEKASVKHCRQADSRSTERPSLKDRSNSPEKQVASENLRGASRHSEHEMSPTRQVSKHKPRSTERSGCNDKSRSPVRDMSKEKSKYEEKPTVREHPSNVEIVHQMSPVRQNTNEKPRSSERPSQKAKSPERQTENEKANRKINESSRERHPSNGSSGTNDNLDNSRWWCDECEVNFLTRELLRQHRREVQCKMGIRRVQAPPRKKSVDLEDVLQINTESGDFFDFCENTSKNTTEVCSSAARKQGKQNCQTSGCQENKSNNAKVKLVETLKPSKKLDRQYVIPKVSSTTTDHSDAGEGCLDLKNKNKKESRISSRDDHKRDRSRSRNRGRSGERCKSGDRARIRSGERGRCGDRGKSGERGRSRSRSREGRGKSGERGRSRSRSREGRRKRSSGKRSRSRRRSPRQSSTSRGRRRPRSRTGSRSRGNRRCRSRSQIRKSSIERLRLMSRKSQSLSPPRISSRRQRKVANPKDLRKQPGRIKKEDICNEDSLEALEKMRNDVWAKLAAMEDEEEGEVVESEDELDISHLKDSEGDRTRKPSGGKLAKKLPHLNSEDPVEKENNQGGNENKSSDTSKESRAANERSSDKESAKERRKNTRGRRKGLGRLRDSSCSISADDLHEVSTEDLDNKLIPFKKRQFKELQFEAKLIQAKLEEARRSKSNTPVHTTEGYATDQIPIITESSFAGIKCHRYDSPQPSTYQNPPTVPHQNLPINVSNEELLAALENMPKVSPIKLSLTGVEVRAPSDKSTSCPLDLMDSASGPTEVTTSVACEPDSTYQADDNATFQLHQQCKNNDYKVLVQDLEVSESEPDSPFPDRTPLYENNYSKSPLKSISSMIHPPKPLSPCRTLSPWRKPPMKSPQSTPLDLSSPSKSKINFPLRSTPMSATHARPLDFTSPEGISNLLKSPIVASNPINASGASPTLPDNIRKLKKVVMATENDENQLHLSGNIQVTKVVPKESRNISSPIPPVIQEDSSRDSVASTGSAKKKRRKLGRSQVSSV